MTNRSESPQPSDPRDAMLRDALRAQSFEEIKARTAEAVRKRPSDTRERWLLFQLLCIDGAWERALKQLQTWPGSSRRARRARNCIAA